MENYKDRFLKELQELKAKTGSTDAVIISEENIRGHELFDDHLNLFYKGLLGLIINGKGRSVVKPNRTLELLLQDVERWNQTRSYYNCHSVTFRSFADEP